MESNGTHVLGADGRELQNDFEGDKDVEETDPPRESQLKGDPL